MFAPHISPLFHLVYLALSYAEFEQLYFHVIEYLIKNKMKPNLTFTTPVFLLLAFMILVSKTGLRRRTMTVIHE